MQRVTSVIRYAFVPVEEALQETFLPDLFQGLGEGAPGKGGTHLPVKQGGLALMYPTMSDPENCMASCVITGHLVAVIRDQEEFQTVDHSTYLQEG